MEIHSTWQESKMWLPLARQSSDRPRCKVIWSFSDSNVWRLLAKFLWVEKVEEFRRGGKKQHEVSFHCGTKMWLFQQQQIVYLSVTIIVLLQNMFIKLILKWDGVAHILWYLHYNKVEYFLQAAVTYREQVYLGKKYILWNVAIVATLCNELQIE